MSVMGFLIVILLFIVGIGLVNERWIHLQSDIALVLFSLIISLVLLFVGMLAPGESLSGPLHQIASFEFESYLLDTVLCFMLFAGASKVNLRKFRQNLKVISLLALLTTVISSLLYGVLFWAAARLFQLPVDIWVCILLGCIVSPTDPIAATGILNKLGLSKNVTSVIESESLFNDGTGVALFVFFRSIVGRSGGSNFLVVMVKEVVGALAVALLVSFVLGILMKLTREPVRQILISVLDVAVVYAVCEHFGFSGVIASVVCGMYLAYVMGGQERKRQVYDSHNLYVDFWDILDSILNAVLFVMIGLSVMNVHISAHIVYVVPVAVVAVILSRFAGVALSSVLLGKGRIPSGYSLMEFVSLMTWSALKGGLSLALAMSTRELLSQETYLIVLNTAYVTILFTVVVQGLTVKNGYRMIERHKARRVRRQSERER
ncbi:MAG: sodium:proton antiporter [bacterium]|nr:sodium:proton antiporter [bacterium]MCM1375264.1 sodium:proton antiporter [Muribaculum sp.]MCM1409820.1 sodium:proton antiporter [Lachnospiraceae bacterium]